MNIISSRLGLLLTIFLYSLLYGQGKAVAPSSAEEVENSLDKQENKTGFDWMGIPFVKFRTDFGLGGGAKVSLYDYGDGNQKPFLYNLQLQYFATNLGKNDHVVYFLAPNFLKKDFDFDIELRYSFTDNSKYFGVGNDAKYNKDYENKDSPSYKSARYYDYQRTKPRFITNILKYVGKHLSVLSGMGVQYTKIERHTKDNVPVPALLFEENAYGVDGGYTNFLKLGLVYDSRDFIDSPEKGIWSEFAIEVAGKYVMSDYNYCRYTLTDRRYYTLLRNLVFAQRTIFEWMSGKPPFYEYSFIGGSATLMEAMGGERALRGYLQNRYIDNTKLITNSELRYMFPVMFCRSSVMFATFFIISLRFFPSAGVAPLNRPLIESERFSIIVRTRVRFPLLLDITLSIFENNS